MKKRRPGAVAFRAETRPWYRRLLGVVFNRWTFAITGFLAVLGFLTFTYFWFEYSDRIDRRLLSGEVFTPTAGIYSSPKILRKGEAMSSLELVEYLKTAGYIEKNNKADAARSRYSFDANEMLIEPGETAVIDGTRNFPNLRIRFGKDNKSVDSILDLDSGSEANQAFLEPKMLSTIAGEGDGRRRTVKFADLPPHLVKAITVTEDRAFFDHYGVNIRGILRAL
ncbi:MAG TPA: hypothetical protein DEP46_07055, partial [Blastocatellia bacterium]|nr:hypothetical protein [Blastocatellia bacterium]